MNAGSYRFKLTLSSLWHLLQGSARLVWDQTISILKLVLILDVSKWQATISFPTMRTAGGKGVIIKCGQGSQLDGCFTVNWVKAKTAGMPRGSYWFYDSRVAPKAQASTWWMWIKGDRGELVHFVDYEESYGGDYAGWQNLKIFMQEFQRLSGLPSSKIGIYTGYYYWIAHSPVRTADLNWFAQFPLWLAWYTQNPSDVKIPRPWTSLLLWQWGTPAYGKHYGVESQEIDCSWFNGDENAYRARFSLPANDDQPPDVEVPVEPLPAIEPEPQIWNAVVTTSANLRVRSYPHTDASNWTGEYVHFGEAFAGRIWMGNGYLWMRIEDTARASLFGKWVAVRSEDGLTKFIRLSVPGSPQPATPVALLPLAKFVEWQDKILAANPSIYRVRKWGDPVLGKSVQDIGVSNFQAVGLYNKSTSSFSGVSNWMRIPHADVNKLAAMQIEDQYIDKVTNWRDQKMRWLVKVGGTIYFFKQLASSGTWYTLPEIQWGTIALGGNLVQVIDVETLAVKLPNEATKRMMKMARLQAFRKSDWDRPLEDMLAEGLAQRCFCAYLPANKFGDSPKGIVYSPFWSPLDWTFITPRQPQPEAFYLPMEWLVR